MAILTLAMLTILAMANESDEAYAITEGCILEEPDPTLYIAMADVDEITAEYEQELESATKEISKLSTEVERLKAALRREERERAETQQTLDRAIDARRAKRAKARTYIERLEELEQN